ncbi:unnamed protein product [Closterium sp. NIES-54]
MHDEPVSDHGSAIRIAFIVKSHLQTGPGIWRLHSSILHRPSVRKILEEVEWQVALKGDGFEVLISHLNASLRAYAREESKRIRVTIAHLASSVAVMNQEMHIMAGMEKELIDEVPSPHLSARIKTWRVRTQIAELAVPGGIVVEPKQILEAASEYFRGLFGEDKRTVVADWTPAPGKRLGFADAECLKEDWYEAWGKCALREMASNKTPAKDGLPKEIFELHWDVLGKYLMTLAKDFTASTLLPTSVKDAVTILLHKKGAKDQSENYRPITLLNISYKVLARVLARRIIRVLHKVISKEQFGFIHRRRIYGAVGLVADVIDAAKNGKEDWFLLLVDFKKAFDSVSWDFIFEVLGKMCFPTRFIGWVNGLHKNTRTNLLVNDWLGEAVEVISGVRQGCPFAPYLFQCAVEPLARKVEKRKIGITLTSCMGQKLAYVGHADDTTLLLQGKQQITKAEEVLEEFEGLAGLTTNKGKSLVLPLGWRSDGFRWARADEAERLLGVWITPSGSCQLTWDKALQRIVRKMMLWQPQYLPIKPRTTLKRELMRQAADLPLGLDTLLPHEKLLKTWEGKSQRWKLACENFMRSPLAVTAVEGSKEEVMMERIAFNKHILMKGTTPVEMQKEAKKL